MRPYLEDLAHLRITVFREFPYLYDGNATYEAQYLRRYSDCPSFLAVLVFDGSRVVGASTCLPLEAEDAVFKNPVKAAGFHPSEVFYFGESVLLPAYRGKGLGHTFFDRREAHARRLGGFRWTTFCAVERSAEDPLRPASYRDLGPFWTGRGYRRRPDVKASLAWKRVDEDQERDHSLTFWMKPVAR